MDTNIFIPGTISPTFKSEFISKNRPQTMIAPYKILVGQVCTEGKAIQYIVDEVKSEVPISGKIICNVR